MLTGGGRRVIINYIIYISYYFHLHTIININMSKAVSFDQCVIKKKIRKYVDIKNEKINMTHHNTNLLI